MLTLGAILALSLLVVVHELGHLVLARLLGVGVDRFSVGFGPPIVAGRAFGTDWVLAAIPLGGYVRVSGMNPHDPAPVRGSYQDAPRWKRLVILGGGSAFNYLLAIGILAWLFAVGTHVPDGMTIGTIQPGSEGARALLRPGDVVVSLDGEPLSSWSTLVSRVGDSPGRAMNLEIQREGTTSSLTVRPRADELGIGRLGVSQRYVFRRHTPSEALTRAFWQTNQFMKEGIREAWALIRGKGRLAASSPQLLVRQARDVASSSLDSFLRVVVRLSLALAFFNLLPIPGLDGGRMLFVLLGAILGRKISPALETVTHAIGVLGLLAAMAWLATRELRQLLQGPTAPPAVVDAPVRPDAGQVATPDGGQDGGLILAPALDGGDGGVAPDGGPITTAESVGADGGYDGGLRLDGGR